MTNEEKARQIAIEYEALCVIDLEDVALKAMQWKDEQMKEALNNILIECDACFDEQTTNTLESIIKHQIEIL